MITCRNKEVYAPGLIVTSLVYRPPTVYVGTMGKVLNRWTGTIYAVKLPSGELYRWLNDQELLPVDTSRHNLRVGDLAIIQLNRQPLFPHPELTNGAVVKIIKIVDTDYYAVKIDGNGEVGWFSGLEISNIF